MHVAVGGYELFLRVSAVTIIKVCIDVTVGVCTGKNTNGVDSRAVRSLAGLCTCDGIVTKCVVDVIRSILCGITVPVNIITTRPLCPSPEMGFASKIELAMSKPVAG